MWCVFLLFFVFKQKTAYDMRISDWSSDVCSSDLDVTRRKPHPDLVLRALRNLQMPADLGCWYVGDSTTDIVAAREAGVSAVFYNGAGWDRHWIDKIFPGTVRHPHVPDTVVANLGELLALARQLISAAAAR